MVAEAGSASRTVSVAGLKALRILTEVQDPFLGEPRACDLYPIRDSIDETIRRAVSLLDDQAWEEAIELLERVSNAVSTTISMAKLVGQYAETDCSTLAVETATLIRRICGAEL